MLKILRKLFGHHESNPSSFKYEDNISAIDRHMRRLLEIQDELGEMAPIFTDVSGQIDESSFDLEDYVSTVNKLRVPGFYAYQLAEEGLLIIQLLAVRKTLISENDNKSEREEQYLVKLDGIEEYVNKTEEILNLTLNDMKPYRTLRGEDVAMHHLQKYLDMKDSQ